MTQIPLSRRNMLVAGAGALVAALSLPRQANAGAVDGESLTNEDIIRKWYAAWEQKDLGAFDRLLADDFTFTSAAGDDHISKQRFKTQCWDTQSGVIERFDLERLATGPDDAFVKYLCHTKNGSTFRNVEYFRIKHGKLESLECYFGAQSSFPSAVSARHGSA